MLDILINKKELFISALLLTLIFFVSGVNKAKNIKGVAKGLEKKLPVLGSSLSLLAIVGVVILEIVAPILIIVSLFGYYKNIGIASCYSIILFTILATYLYHHPSKKENFHPFMRNIAIIGGFIALAKHI
tara:strand:- start:127 stop:516 length:390 start_codon:yes stop_codon:yes gene_type:complete